MDNFLRDFGFLGETLADESNGLCRAIERARRYLAKLDLGLTASVPFGESSRLEYNKGSGDWGFWVFTSEDTCVGELSNCPRELRIKAARALPRLLAALCNKGHWMVADIKAVHMGLSGLSDDGLELLEFLRDLVVVLRLEESNPLEDPEKERFSQRLCERWVGQLSDDLGGSIGAFECVAHQPLSQHETRALQLLADAWAQVGFDMDDVHPSEYDETYWAWERMHEKVRALPLDPA